ncbi:MAG: hypothetical protein RSG77_20845 [Hafnia sp.]
MTEKNMFGQRQVTPMQSLKTHLAQFMALPNLVSNHLNRQSHRLRVMGEEGAQYERKPISFDSVYLYRFVTGLSFSFGFNYKNVEIQTVRASLKLSKTSGIEYSKEYSVEEAKVLLREFFILHDEDALAKFGFARMGEFTKLFAQHFGITLSASLTPDQIKAHKNEVMTKVNALREQIKAKQDAMIPIRKLGKNKTADQRHQLRQLTSEAAALFVELSAALQDQLKDIPCVAREMVFKDLKLDT